jgi:hypothetical protein
MNDYSNQYLVGRQLALREFEKQAVLGSLVTAGKFLWNSPLKKALGYLTGFGGRIGKPGSFAYKYMPSSTVGFGLTSGTMNAAMAEEGNRANAFATGAIAAGAGMGAFRGMSHIGKRVIAPWMRRGNMARYSKMGFGDDASKLLQQKNEFGYMDDILNHTGGHMGKLKNYTNTQQFKLLNPEHQKLITDSLTAAKANKGYFSEEARKQISNINADYIAKAKDLVANTSGAAKYKYHLGTKAKYVGALGGGLGISTATHEPIANAVGNTVGRVIPKTKQTPSNMYNPYYGGM